MDIQAVLTSDVALLCYALIIMAILIVLILKIRKANKGYTEKKEQAEYNRQRMGLDSMLSNKKRR